MKEGPRGIWGLFGFQVLAVSAQRFGVQILTRKREARMPKFAILKREIARVARQMKAPLLYASSKFMTFNHDQKKHNRSRLTPGKQSRGENVCLFLIFQPKGLSGSTFQTCKHLAKKGFTCLIVSNAKLSQFDRDALEPHCFAILERPNFGYDFGGYRDGILHLLATKIPIDRLLVLNDSVWFPTFEQEDFLDRVSTQTTNIYGAVMSQRKTTRGENRYVQSYAFSFDRDIISSAAFETYWKSLAILSDRAWTIQHCERKMSGWFRKRGFSVGARWSFADAVLALRDLTPADLVLVLQMEAEIDPRRRQRIANLISHENEPGWRAEVESYIASSDFRKFILMLHPSLQAAMHIPFLKKSSATGFVVCRKHYTGLMKERCDPIVFDEILQLDG